MRAWNFELASRRAMDYLKGTQPSPVVGTLAVVPKGAGLEDVALITEVGR